MFKWGFLFFLLFFFANFWQKSEEIDSESRRTIFQSGFPSLHCYECQQKHAGSLSKGTGVLQTPHQPWLLRAARAVCCSRAAGSRARQGWSPLLLVLIDPLFKQTQKVQGTWSSATMNINQLQTATYSSFKRSGAGQFPSKCTKISLQQL